MSSSSVANAALAQQRRQRGLDPPAAAHRQLLAGARLEQAGEDAARAVAYLHAGCSSVREAIRRAILSGGRTAQASPASSTARGIPQTAQLRFVLGDDRAAARDQARRAFDAVAAHAGEHDAERARAVDRADRRQHRIDRGHAAAASCGLGSAGRSTPFVDGLERQMGIARREQDAVGAQLHAVLGDDRLALGRSRRAGARTRS